MEVNNYRGLVVEYLSKLSGNKCLDDSIDIIETGLVNSLAVIQIISFLEKTFCIKVEINDLDIKNFSSVNAICCFLNSKLVSHD